MNVTYQVFDFQPGNLWCHAVKNQNRMADSKDPNEKVYLWADSSGITLYANVAILVCRAGRIWDILFQNLHK